MPDFSKGSTFNKDANFQGVKFGADAPLLETELNELQDIQTEARADIVRDSIPSGFTQLGELDFSYMSSMENCIRLKSESTAYVHGYKITIPKDTIIDIGRAPEKDSREDLIFLEVWREEVTKDSNLTIAGGEGQAPISNNIQDLRVGQETSRRTILKWRIRHVTDIDFNSGYHTNGFNSVATVTESKVLPQGGNLSPISDAYETRFLIFGGNQFVGTSRGNSVPSNSVFSDKGLAVSGMGASTKGVLKTLDGYVYAIPMFRLYRKASCGKAKPFEYQKINPKVDYYKVLNILKDEKVESVDNLSIEGSSLVNLIDKSGIVNNINFNCIEQIKTHFFINSTDRLKKGVTYTFIFDYEITNIVKGASPNVYVEFRYKDTSTQQYKYIRLVTNMQNNLKRFCKVPITLTENYDGTIENLSLAIWDCNINININTILLLEGDWTNKEVPKSFSGITSLGESENNLIEVKNSILNESSYDPSTGTSKLNTVSGTNYVTSDNLIMPNIEAQVKRGDSKLSDLTSLGKIDSLVGDEKIEFTKIQGRTLHNLFKALRSKPNEWVETIDGYSINLPKGSGQPILTFNLAYALKPDTKYTVIFSIPKYTSGVPHICFMDKDNSTIATTTEYTPSAKGIYVTTLTTKSTPLGEILRVIPRNGVDNNYTIGKDIIVLEGDYTSTSLDLLPYIDGIKSVGELESNKLNLKRTGKNLISSNNININPSWKIIFDKENGTITCTDNSVYNDIQFHVYLTKGNTYKLSIDNLNLLVNNVQLMYGKVGGYNEPLLCKHTTIKDNGVIQFNDITGWYTIHIPNIRNTIKNIMLEPGDVYTSFEVYKEHKQIITLKEPLRSLPNGVCDTIEGNKVIRRVHKLLLTGELDGVSGGYSGEDFVEFYVSEAKLKLKGKNYGSGAFKDNSICSMLVSPKYGSMKPTGEVEWCYVNGLGGLSIRLAKSRLDTSTTNGNYIVATKNWLNANPVYVYYELETPIEEYIEPNYDKESVKTYQLDAPLRKLSDKFKDEIIDGKLIRRCGEVLIDGNASQVYSGWFSNDSCRSIGYKPDNLGVFNWVKVACDNLTPKLYTEGLENSQTECIGIWDGNIGIALYVNVSKLTSNDTNGVRQYLKSNPVRVIYPLAEPIEIPLKEVSHDKADFSKNRMFKVGQYLREIPNGAKDIVDVNKVKRNTKTLTLTGAEEWVLHNDGVNNNTLAFHTNIATDKKPNTVMLCDKFEYAHSTLIPTADRELISGQLETSVIYIRILKSKLETQDANGFKKWLSLNPVRVLYELQTPTEEALTPFNSMYPPHHDLNSYCGGLYVGNGTNDIYTNNSMSIDNVLVKTPYREFNNKAVITDCNYKRGTNGYDNYMLCSKNKNLAPLTENNVNFGTIISQSNGWVVGVKFPNFNYEGNMRAWCNQLIPVKSNTRYTLSLKDSNIQVSIQEYNGYLIDVFDSNWRGSGYSFTTTSETKYLALYLRKADNSVISDSELHNLFVDTIQIEEGSKPTAFESFVPNFRAIENLESNDIDDIRHLVSLTGFNYDKVLNDSFDKLLKGEL